MRISAYTIGPLVAAGRRVKHSPARMVPPAAHMRSHAPRYWLKVALVMALSATWPVAAAPEMTATGAAIATGSDVLETTITVEKRLAPVTPAGLGRFAPADRLEAGEEAYYTIQVHNPGKSPVNDVQVTKRMPDGMVYIEGSATGPDCEVQLSTDGGETFAARAAPGPYTHLRWILRQPLPPGATALLRFRATFR
jgi:uncharacterized repeat protein (TIGR01451 family)